jgi:hypothetical protein
MTLPLAIVLAALILALPMILRPRPEIPGLSHKDREWFIAEMAELQLQLHERLTTINHEWRRDLDGLHKRIEYLEARDRDRPD